MLTSVCKWEKETEAGCFHRLCLSLSCGSGLPRQEFCDDSSGFLSQLSVSRGSSVTTPITTVLSVPLFPLTPMSSFNKHTESSLITQVMTS